MIRTRKDLKFYLQEDGKRNGYPTVGLRYMIHWLIGSENAKSYSYLRALRHCEYHCGKKSIYHRLAYLYWSMTRAYRGSRYHIQIPLNKCGYGLRIMHLSGGGGGTFKCQ